jgi:hypothetical protein
MKHSFFSKTPILNVHCIIEQERERERKRVKETKAKHQKKICSSTTDIFDRNIVYAEPQFSSREWKGYGEPHIADRSLITHLLKHLFS